MHVEIILIIFINFIIVFGYYNKDYPVVPKEFDARDNWPNCPSLTEVLDQGNCGADWALVITSCINDRLCINSNGTDNRRVSAQDLLECNDDNNGCLGGNPKEGWKYWVDQGIVTEECKPFTAGQNGVIFTCDMACVDNYDKLYEDDKIHGSSFKYMLSEYESQAEIYINGSVHVTMNLYDDFFNYTSGDIFKTVTGNVIGKIAVKLVGWGEYRFEPYWIGIAPWGSQFGTNGSFKIRRGFDWYNIEQSAYIGFL